MTIQSVGILSPGDMGQAIAMVLSQHGLQTLAALDNRSVRTQQLAAEVPMRNVGSLKNLVIEADIVLSVMLPAAATAAAEQLAAVIREVGKPLLYVDANAIAPHRVQRIGQMIEATGGQFVDAAIIGPPPRLANRTRIYASGSQANQLAILKEYGLDIRVIGEEIGQASGLKMCYAALTKGLTAIGTELLIAAHHMGLDSVLEAELTNSQSELLTHLSQAIPSMTPKAHRWVGEMAEIADTFKELGLTEQIFQGAADMYELVKETSLGKATPEERKGKHSLKQVIATLADEMGV